MSIKVISTGACFNRRAARSPANPPPTITTRFARLSGMDMARSWGTLPANSNTTPRRFRATRTDLARDVAGSGGRGIRELSGAELDAAPSELPRPHPTPLHPRNNPYFTMHHNARTPSRHPIFFPSAYVLPEYAIPTS